MCLRIRHLLQVAIALQGGDIIYFELDQLGQLLETEKKEVRLASEYRGLSCQIPQYL